MVPEDSVTKVLLAPIYIPIGILGGIFDIFLIHPISVIPDSVEDTADLFWDPDDDLGYVTLMGTIPGRVIITPLFFTLSWMGRSLFDIETNRTSNNKPEIDPGKLLEQLLKANDRAGMEEWFGTYHHHKKDYSNLVRKVYFNFSESQGANTEIQIQNAALYYLSAHRRFPQNEPFLLKEFQKLIFNSEQRPHPGKLHVLLNAIIENRSGNGSAIILEFLSSDQKITNEDLLKYIQAIITIGNEEHIDQIKKRLSAGNSR